MLAPREDAELEGLDADDAGRLLLLVWNTAGGGSELELLDTVTGASRTRAGPPRARGQRRAAQPGRHRPALISVEGPRRPRELWSLDVATMTWTRVDRRAPACRRPTSWSRRCSSSTAATDCR